MQLTIATMQDKYDDFNRKYWNGNLRTSQDVRFVLTDDKSQLPSDAAAAFNCSWIDNANGVPVSSYDFSIVILSDFAKTDLTANQLILHEMIHSELAQLLDVDEAHSKDPNFHSDTFEERRSQLSILVGYDIPDGNKNFVWSFGNVLRRRQDCKSAFELTIGSSPGRS